MLVKPLTLHLLHVHVIMAVVERISFHWCIQPAILARRIEENQEVSGLWFLQNIELSVLVSLEG